MDEFEKRACASALNGFIHQHYGNVVHDRIDTAARCAAEPVMFLSQFHWLFAGWTNQDIEQLLRNGHIQILTSDHF